MVIVFVAFGAFFGAGFVAEFLDAVVAAGRAEAGAAFVAGGFGPAAGSRRPLRGAFAGAAALRIPSSRRPPAAAGWPLRLVAGRLVVVGGRGSSPPPQAASAAAQSGSEQQRRDLPGTSHGCADSSD